MTTSQPTPLDGRCVPRLRDMTARHLFCLSHNPLGDCNEQ